jgi:MoxR-like ATPase
LTARNQHTRGPRPVDATNSPPAQEAVPDIVRGKGKGLIILLHGAPGTGKTSTAETIAEATGRPLLLVTCGK